MIVKSAVPWAPEPGPVAITLRNVDWQTYRRLREEPANARLAMTYDHGTLEIMSPSRLHERIAELIGHMIVDWGMEHEIPVCPAGALTVSREDLQRGCEPDKCYFIQHEEELRNRDEFSLDRG